MFTYLKTILPNGISEDNKKREKKCGFTLHCEEQYSIEELKNEAQIYNHRITCS